MKSPFPSMDPYLANHWGDVGLSLVVYGSGLLNQSLPTDLVARTNYREVSDTVKCDFPRERFIEILEYKPEYRLVTLIRFVNPGRGPAPAEIQKYWMDHLRRKKNEVNFVELDLVCERQVVIRRASNWNQVETMLLSIRECIPTISIPLRKQDAEVSLNLQPLIDRAYVNGRYDSLNYQIDADPPLTEADAEWADALLRAAGKRT